MRRLAVGKTERPDVLCKIKKGFGQEFQDKLDFYKGLAAIPPDVSPPNKAVIVIAAICICSICYLAKVNAAWYGYVCVVFLSTSYCSFAVWREKNAKSKHTDSS